MTLYPGVIAKSVNRRSSDDMMNGRQFLNEGAKLLFLDGANRLEAMKEHHVESPVGLILRHIKARSIVTENKIVTKEGKIKRKTLENKVTGIVRHNPTFMDLIKSILNFAIAFEEYKEKFAATRIVGTVEHDGHCFFDEN